MPRSAAIVLFLGLILPAAGQTDRPQPHRLEPGGFSEFAPRGRPRNSAGNANSGNLSPPGQRAPAGRYPPGYQPMGNGYPAANGGVEGLAGYPPQGYPTQTGAPGVNPQNRPPEPLPTQGFLLDARLARAEKGRVPNGFGQLGLSQDQRERIYGIQNLYDGQIKKLEALIERLKAEEDVQYQYVLTQTQRVMYQRYKAEKGGGVGK